jgi:hypothetical protein
MHTAFRYKSINPSADRPYLAVYPVNDVDWLGGWEFNKEIVSRLAVAIFPDRVENVLILWALILGSMRRCMGLRVRVRSPVCGNF